MAAYIAQQTVKQLIKSGDCIRGSKVVVLGLTFKENCPDIRNSKVADLVKELLDYGCEVFVNDPIAEVNSAWREYQITLIPWDDLPQANALIVAVPHRKYLEMPLDSLLSKLKPAGVFVDVKSTFPRQKIVGSGMSVWRM